MMQQVAKKNVRNMQNANFGPTILMEIGVGLNQQMLLIQQVHATPVLVDPEIVQMVSSKGH